MILAVVAIIYIVLEILVFSKNKKEHRRIQKELDQSRRNQGLFTFNYHLNTMNHSSRTMKNRLQEKINPNYREEYKKLINDLGNHYDEVQKEEEYLKNLLAPYLEKEREIEEEAKRAAEHARRRRTSSSSYGYGYGGGSSSSGSSSSSGGWSGGGGSASGGGSSSSW